MTHAEWTTAVAPKVKGAWNLHNALRSLPLGFFLLASSLFSSIEHPGKANYHAANTFLESLCQYRHSLHLPASVLSICPIDNIGFFAANPHIRAQMAAQGSYFLSERSFLDFATYALRTSHDVQNSSAANGAWKSPGHISIGLYSSLPLSHPENRTVWRRDRRRGRSRGGGSRRG